MVVVKLDYESVENGPDVIEYCPICGSDDIQHIGFRNSSDGQWRGYDRIHSFNCEECGGFEYTDRFRTKPDSVSVEDSDQEVYNQLAGQANALGLLLTNNDIEYSRIKSKNPIHSAEVFEAQVGVASDDRDEFDELIREKDYLSWMSNRLKIQVEYDGLYTDLGLVADELDSCNHTECTDSADRFSIFPDIGVVKQYCDDHAEGAFRSLKAP